LASWVPFIWCLVDVHSAPVAGNTSTPNRFEQR
jgi:hypothetical protein